VSKLNAIVLSCSK